MPEPESYLRHARRRQRPLTDAQRRRDASPNLGPGVPTTELTGAGAAAMSATGAVPLYQPRFPRPHLPYPARPSRGQPRRRTQPAARISPPATPSRLPVAAEAGSAISLPEEFERVQREQLEARSREIKSRPRFLRLPQSRWKTAAIAVPSVLLLVALAILGPVIYEATRAYQDVFVEQVPHDDPEAPAVVAAVNPEGTPALPTAQSEADEEQQQAAIPEWDGKERITILLLGIDYRPEEETTRTDTMILVNVDPIAKSASMLSIPRDMQVIIPGYGVNKINAAYSYGDYYKEPGGGPGLTIRTIEANFGIQISYFAQVDFNGFIDIIDTVGGVTIDVPYAIKDDAYPASGNNYMRVYFPAGWQHLDGERALQYARTRHDDGDSSRSARQLQVLMALREQAVKLDLLPRAAELIADFRESVRTDLSPTQALQLARLASELTPDDIVSHSLDPALTEEQLPDQPYYLVPDWDAVGAIMTEFTGTTVSPPASAIADPNYDVPILVQNGALVDGIAGRVAEVLVANGFTNVEIGDAPDTGSYPQTTVTANSDDVATAMAVAGVVGIGIAAIDTGSPNPAAPTAAEQGGIVIVLGADAPDPAYFEPIGEEPVTFSENETGVGGVTTEAPSVDTGAAEIGPVGSDATDLDDASTADDSFFDYQEEPESPDGG